MHIPTRRTITRAELAKRLSLIYPQLSFRKAREIVDAVFKEIETGLREDGEVKLTNFGVFMLRAKRERMGRNPATGEKAIIIARNTVQFKAAHRLKHPQSGGRHKPKLTQIVG